MRQALRLLGVVLATVLAAAAVPARSARAEDLAATGARVRLLELRPAGDEKTDVLELRGDRPLSFTTLRLQAPPRIVIDLPETDLAAAPAELVLDDGTFRRVAAAAAGTHTSRVVVELVAEGEFTVRAVGSRLELRVPRQPRRLALAPVEQPTPARARRDAAPSAPADGEPPPLAQTARVAATPSSPGGPAAAQAEVPARAAPAAVARPERADSPAAGGPAPSTPAAAQAPRQPPEPTEPGPPRVARAPTPGGGTTSDPSSAPNVAPAEPVSPPARSALPPARSAPSPARSAPPPARSASPPARSASPPARSASPPARSASPPARSASPPARSAPPPAPPVRVAASEASRAPGARATGTAPAHRPVTAPAREAAARPPAAGVLLRGLGFRPAEGGSVIVRADKLLAYGLGGSGRAIVLTLPGARFQHPNDRRVLDARYFGTLVQRVVPSEGPRGVELRIELGAEASARVRQVDSTLVVTFAPLAP